MRENKGLTSSVCFQIALLMYDLIKELTITSSYLKEKLQWEKLDFFRKTKKIFEKRSKNPKFARKQMDNCWTGYDNVYVQQNKHYLI